MSSDLPTSREGGLQPYGQSNFLKLTEASSLQAELQVPFPIWRSFNLEGGRSVVKGNSGFPKSSKGMWNFIICSLQASRHPFVGSIFSAFRTFHKVKHFHFVVEALSDLRAVDCLSGWIKPPRCAVGFLKDTGLKPANPSIEWSKKIREGLLTCSKWYLSLLFSTHHMVHHEKPIHAECGSTVRLPFSSQTCPMLAFVPQTGIASSLSASNFFLSMDRDIMSKASYSSPEVPSSGLGSDRQCNGVLLGKRVYPIPYLMFSTFNQFIGFCLSVYNDL